MSRIGKKIIVLPENVSFDINGKKVTVKGPKGQLERVIPEEITVELNEGTVQVKRESDVKRVSALHGLTRSLLQNMVTGVSEGITKTLILFGVGFKMEVKKNYLVLNLGYSHPIYFGIPKGITIEATNPITNKSSVTVTGIDKEIVGLVASKIRALKKPEPYKGKGFRYSDEVIVRKAGKTAK